MLHPTSDPLAAFVTGAVTGDDKRPLPLLATDFTVTLKGGLALVETTRVFRNDEAESIEATLTFPLPVQATLFALEARIGERRLTARARRRETARADYEAALERGKTAVLHEELLRGVHMLSVGHIPAGAEIAVTLRWSTTLTLLAPHWHLRIPLTVGDIYGRSPLPDSDELIHGGPPQPDATLTVIAPGARVTLANGTLENGKAQVPLNRPLDLTVSDWQPAPLTGRAADGRTVTLTVAPAPLGEQPLEAALLLDHSGSMSGGKHAAAVAALRRLTGRLEAQDRLELWEFDNVLARVGESRGGRDLDALLQRLTPPRGGTEIGGALAGVLAGSPCRDLLLVTDGKSHALDVQALARAGRRIAVLLVGEDSLEARVGQLAALTGGEIFVAADAELEQSLLAALAALRRPATPPAPIEPPLTEIAAQRAGAQITARWSDEPLPEADESFARAVAAHAAALALPALPEEAAAALAEREGLVTHLTSLLLVDEAGETQEGLPASRKVPLPSPAPYTVHASAMLSEAALTPRGTSLIAHMAPRPKPPGTFPPPLSPPQRPTRPQGAPIRIELDWDAAPARLLAGDLTGLPRLQAAAIEHLAAEPALLALAQRLGLAPQLLVIALLARAAAARNRSAARIARRLLGPFQGTADEQAIAALARTLGLAP